MSRTLIFAAVSGLMMSTAVAQAPTSNPAQATPPAAASSAPAAQSNDDELLASKLKGAAVYGSDDQKVGDITDVLFDKMGHVKAYIVSVGGILGIGAKDVALEQSAFEEMAAAVGRPEERQFEAYQLKVQMTKDRLKQMATFKPMSNAPTTTGAAPATRVQPEIPPEAPR
jgi:hypothetical protein